MPRLSFLQPTARELRRRLDGDGVRGAASFLVAGAQAQLIKRETLLVLVKPLDAIVVPARRGTVRIEPLERRHLPALRELNRERGDVGGDARFAGDLEAGFRGIAAFADDELVGCYWWVDASMPRHRDMDELGLDIALESRDVYGYDLYVHKEHRTGGAVPDFLHQVETTLRDRGFERLWGAVAADNRGARWTYTARGYVPISKVERTRVLRRWRNRVVAIQPKPERASV